MRVVISSLLLLLPQGEDFSHFYLSSAMGSLPPVTVLHELLRHGSSLWAAVLQELFQHGFIPSVLSIGFSPSRMDCSSISLHKVLSPATNPFQDGLLSLHSVTNPAKSLLYCRLPTGIQPTSGTSTSWWSHETQVDNCCQSGCVYIFPFPVSIL